jgi:glycosyltransferase involved in cell wall biosynthesis
MTPTTGFAVNGRFLTQTATGVQRYAYHVVRSMGESCQGNSQIPLLVPKGTSVPAMTSIRVVETGGHLKGHIWEQALPAMNGSGRLLNLCNTAPVALTDQVVCIHDANVYTEPGSYSPAFRMLYKTMQPLIVRRSVSVTTVSQASARQISRHLPIALSDIAILPNGHEHVHDWDPAAAVIAPAIVAKIQTRGRRYVFALGSLAHHKNLQLLITIAPALDEMNIDVVIAGGGLDILTARALQQRPNVVLTGRVSDDDLAYLLQHALCLAFPSFTEGFGLPIVEAMALRCPVISSSQSSMLEVCGNAALLASPFKPSDWVAQIAALGGSSFLSDDLIHRGLRQVEKFSWTDTAAAYLELLETPSMATKPRLEPVSIPLKVAIVVATRGRPQLVAQTVRHLLSTQTVSPDMTIVSCCDVSDAGDLNEVDAVKIVTGKAGLAAQRNTALDNLPEGIDIVIFFDDDFVAHPDWIAAARAAFSDESRLCAFTGWVVADGILGPGIAFDEAVMLSKRDATGKERQWIEPFSPYGCNMAFRMSAVGKHRFDERLVLYGWLEDRDFAGGLAKQGGRLAKSASARGVHMGAKIGRVNGERLGYSQIVNPLYMRLKKTMTTRQAAGQITRNVMSNFGRLLRPEPFIDRGGRARGNLLALRDVILGRIEPERAAEVAVRNENVPVLAEGRPR